VNRREAVGEALDVVEEGWRVPDVADVEAEPDLGRARLVEQIQRGGNEDTIVQSSPPSLWSGSRPTRIPAWSASAAIVRRPATTSARASSGSRPRAEPVRSTSDSGSKAARRRIDPQ
jgi:hypothetical protein